MTTRILIGNLISLVAAVFTARSSWSKTTRAIYMNQVAQCLLLAVASVFFDSYAGIVTLVVCALRNYLAATDRLSRPAMLGCAAFMAIFGPLMNNRGAVGWIVIVANVVYTVGMYRARRELTIKLNIILNLSLWILYECFILDIPSIVADSIGLAVAIVSSARLLRARHS